MTVNIVSGDPLLTQAQTLAFGHNANGRTELGDLETLLLNRYPTAFSAYARQCKQDRMHPGDCWLWRDTQPQLAFLIVRDSSVSATRLRYVQSVAMSLSRDYLLYGIKSMAIAPLANEYEWPEIRDMLAMWLGKSALPVIIYDSYIPGIQVCEGLPPV